MQRLVHFEHHTKAMSCCAISVLKGQQCWFPSAHLILARGTLQIAYNIDVVKSNIPEALEVLSDAVLNPRFTSWEVAEAVQKIEQDIKGLKENPQTVLLEVSNTSRLML